MKVIITGGRASAAGGEGERYWPAANKIVVFTDAIRGYYVCWRRVVVAVYAHELVHRLFWHFIFRHNMEKWLRLAERDEYWAYLVQGVVCRLLFTGVDVKVIRDVAGK